MLRERPYFSCKVLCPHFSIAQGTCLRSLHETFGMKKFHLRWVPYALVMNRKAERVTFAHGIVSALQSIHSAGLQSLVTGYESWFFLDCLCDSIWASSRDETPKRASQKSDTEKCLISLLWSANGIYSLFNVLKGSTHNSTLFCDIVVPKIQHLRNSSERYLVQN
jgi:hypothetical protein